MSSHWKKIFVSRLCGLKEQSVQLHTSSTCSFFGSWLRTDGGSRFSPCGKTMSNEVGAQASWSVQIQIGVVFGGQAGQL